jgi:hypothetical protein
MQLKVHKLKELSELEEVHQKTAEYRAKRWIYIQVEVPVSTHGKKSIFRYLSKKDSETFKKGLENWK